MRKTICLIVFAGLCGISQAIIFQVNGPVIKGKVTDSNGAALTGAAVTIENTILGVHTDSEGNYSISVPRNGEFKVHYSFIGYESTDLDLRLKKDTVLNITLLTKSVHD